MHPQPPKRSDSAKYSSVSHSKGHAQTQGSLEEYHRSFGQLPNFLVEPSQQKKNPIVAGIVPPLSSYSPTASPVGKVSTGYMAKEFQSHSRHPNGSTSMINVAYYANTPPISPRKYSLNKVIPKASESKLGNGLENDASCPKMDEFIGFDNESEYSVDDFIAKLLRFDETTIERKGSKNRKFSRKQLPNLNDDSYKDSLNELLRVSLLEKEELPKRSFKPPKSCDFDPEFKDRTAKKIPPRNSSRIFSESLESFTLQPIDTSQAQLLPSVSENRNPTEMNALPITPEKSLAGKSLIQGSKSITSSSNLPPISVIPVEVVSPIIMEVASPNPIEVASPSPIDVFPNTVDGILPSPVEAEKNAAVNLTSYSDGKSVYSISNFDRKSNSTESSSSSSFSVVGVDVVKPTFQTLRRKRASKDQSFAESTEYIPSDASFAEMKITAKKSNNPQVQFDFAKFCIQLGDPYADTGLSILQKLAKSGFSDAQFVLGQAYADDQRYDIALRYFSAATKRNHYEAAYEAGYLCEHGGSGLKKNEREALNYYIKAGTSGHKKAMYRLALAELYGQLGLKRNINNGMKWLNRGEAVADVDCPEPLYELSLIYEVGIYPVVISDPDHAFSLLKEAADLKYPPALYKLGYCYEYGYLGVQIEKSISINLYQTSAKAGNKEAQLALSGWLLSGYNSVIVKNEREAFYWAHLSALQGLARAEYTMGYFLESGIGATANVSEAIKWYKEAARQGDDMALKRLSEIGLIIKSSKSPKKNRDHRTMKEYSKLVQKENTLTQELINLSARLELPVLTIYNTPQQDLKNELRDLQKVINSGDIQLIKLKIHEFEGKLSQEKLLLCSKMADMAMEEVNNTIQVEKLQEIIQNHTNNNSVYSIPPKKEYSVKNLKEEEEYLDFVRKHGSTGGWDAVNHSTFISLREKYHDDLDNFYKICVDRIPGMLWSDIQKHEEWYRNYARLVQNRKKKIQEWKKSKAIEAEKLIKDLESEENHLKVQSSVETQRETRKRQEIRKALQEWKNSKNAEKSSEEVEREPEKPLDKLKELEKRKRIKEKVEAYVERKTQIQALEEELLAVSKELTRREKDSRYAIENRKFKKKDNDFLEKRREILHRKENDQLKREKRLQTLLSKVAVEVPRDPKRLMQPTISLQLKVATPDDECEKVKSTFQPGERSYDAGN